MFTQTGDYSYFDNDLSPFSDSFVPRPSVAEQAHDINLLSTETMCVCRAGTLELVIDTITEHIQGWANEMVEEVAEAEVARL